MTRAAPSAQLLGLWRKLSPLPGGAWLFGVALGWMVPYSGTLHARVLRLEPGHSTLALRERHALRNHLRSVHAIALANLGELASGLAMIAALPADVRGIVTGLSVEYLKKARGTITADCMCTVPTITAPTDHVVHAELRDAAGEPVARVTVNWRLAPERG